MIEVEKLLHPVSDENPAGESLRYSDVYDRIKAARREDDSSMAQGIWQTKLKKADWLEVQNLCLEALETRSKDLQIGAWLLEACIHLNGFAGAAEGLKVLVALCENFWETLYPPLDPSEPDYRFGPIVWIDEKLTMKLKSIPITQPKSDEEPPYSWAYWESAQHQVTVAARSAAKGKPVKAADGGKAAEAAFTKSLGLTPPEFYVELRRQLSDVLDQAYRFEQVLVRFDVTQEGALHHMKDLLGDIQHFVGQVLKERGTDMDTEPEPEVAMQEEPEPVITPEPQPEPQIGGPIRSRAQAYQMLEQAAEYLMKTEPHSPTPYLVRRAVAWGGMSLGEVLQQLLRNPGELTELYRFLGLDDFPPKK
jgi:type VI secretion system protein ImpA